MPIKKIKDPIGAARDHELVMERIAKDILAQVAIRDHDGTINKGQIAYVLDKLHEANAYHRQMLEDVGQLRG